MKKPNLAIVGATGLVGSTFLKVLEEVDFPFDNLYLMASAKSAGKTVTFKGKDYVVEELTENSFELLLYSFVDISCSHIIDKYDSWIDITFRFHSSQFRN